MTIYEVLVVSISIKVGHVMLPQAYHRLSIIFSQNVTMDKIIQSTEDDGS